MKKIILGISIFSLLLFALATYSNSARADNRSDSEKHETNHNNNHGVFDPGKNLVKSACGDNLGKPVVDVKQKVQNDADSGQAGDYWAFDYYNRQITVWSTGASTYCAIVTYSGNFYAIPGQVGPGDTGSGALINTPTDQPVNGPFSGGRRATITGTLLATPLWPTSGSVGTTNYQCDINANCPGFVSWPDQYFSAGYTYSDDWWGWKYDGGSHGTWINAISGNSGNIL